MKRITTITIVLALAVLGLALPAAATTALEMAPGTGPAGTEVAIHGVGFTPVSTFEVHGEGFDGPLLNAGTSNDRGEFSLAITIPTDAAPGDYTIAICETQFVACTDTESDFWVGTTATFTVEMVLVLHPPAATGSGIGSTPPGGGVTPASPSVTVPPALPPTTTGIPLVELLPSSGDAGSDTIVAVSGFTPDSDFEVHGYGYGLGLIASGTTDGAGEAAVAITIPDDAVRAFTVAVCETSYVACTDTESDFWVGASAEFTVDHHIAADPAGDDAIDSDESDGSTTGLAPTDTDGDDSDGIDDAGDATTVDSSVDSSEAQLTDKGIATAGDLQQNRVQTGGTSGNPTDANGAWWLLLIALATSLLGALLGWRLRSHR